MKPGHVICDECGGKGGGKRRSDYVRGYSHTDWCIRCNGYGEVYIGVSPHNSGQSRSDGTGAGPIFPPPSAPKAPVPHYQEIADMLMKVERERSERAADDLRRRVSFDQET